MAIRVVRLGSARAKGEGPRIGTVRRPPRGVPKSEFAAQNWYDVWFPNLAPSVETMKLGQEANTPARWASFVRKYRAEMAAPEARRTRVKTLLSVLIAVLATLLCAAESDTGAEKAFKQLQSLIGNWEGRFEDGRSHSVSYTMTAGGTVLVETWTLAPGRESMTLYSMDSNDLIATHYCPQGNQPRLQFAGGSESGRISFEFRDGTNLQVQGKSHQHAFWIRILDENSFERSETYVDNGSTTSAIAKMQPGKAIAYTRIGSMDQER